MAFNPHILSEMDRFERELTGGMPHRMPAPPPLRPPPGMNLAFIPHSLQRMPFGGMPHRPPPPRMLPPPRMPAVLEAQPTRYVQDVSESAVVYDESVESKNSASTSGSIGPAQPRPPPPKVPKMQTFAYSGPGMSSDMAAQVAAQAAHAAASAHMAGMAYGGDGAGPSSVIKADKKLKKLCTRVVGEKKWLDPTLASWDPNDFRLFCGDLGNEVNDDVLTRTFRKYASFQKARVVRDKNTNKSRGFGFVSFSDPSDLVRAMREMNGKYVGNRPIKLRKSNWKDRNIDTVRQKSKEKKKLGLKL